MNFHQPQAGGTHDILTDYVELWVQTKRASVGTDTESLGLPQASPLEMADQCLQLLDRHWQPHRQAKPR